MDPDPGGPKTRGSGGSGSATLLPTNIVRKIHGLIIKCRHLIKVTCKGTLRQMFIRDTVGHVVIFDPAYKIDRPPQTNT